MEASCRGMAGKRAVGRVRPAMKCGGDILVLTAALLAPGLVGAQDGSGANDDLEEIVVQATRMSRPLDRVPGAVTVVSQTEIQLGRQQLGLDEALNRVPGLFMQNRYNFAQDLRISIRGFGARSAFGIRGVKILVDGIPETLPDGQGQVDSIDLGAIRQIEVLRGPSSSLYGNASGGVISVASERGPEIPFANVRLTAGDYGAQKFQAKTGGQADRVNYFVSVSDSRVDGYRVHSETENTQLSGRLEFDLGNRGSLLAVANYTDQPVSNDPGGINLAQAQADPRSARDRNLGFDSGEALEQTRIGFVYTLPTGEGSELQVRNYYVSRDFNNRLPFRGGGAVDLQRFFAGGGISYTHRGSLAGKLNRVIVGLDYDDQDDHRRRFNNNMGVPGALTLDQDEHVTSTGLFVQDALTITDNVELSFGVRFDAVEFDVGDRFLGNGDDSGGRTVDDASPMIGLLVVLSPELSIYGTMSTSFETPTTTEFANPSGAGGFNPLLEPQAATNLEIGLRGGQGRRTRYELAVFDIEVDDELIPYEIPSSPGRDFFANAGRSDRTGVEAMLVSQPTDRIGVTLSYTYADFEFADFVDDNGRDYSGNRIPGTVEQLLFAEIYYRHPAGWFGALDALTVGDQFANNANTVADAAYTLSNLRLGFDASMGGVTYSPFVGINNLFDERYNSNIRINAFGGRFFEPGPGRNAYAGVAVNFDLR